MNGHSEKSLQATPEQLIYADVLEKGMYFGLLILLATFLVYVLGIVSPYIAITEISRYWSMGVTDYLHEANIPHGWAWVPLVGYSDFLNFVGIAILAGVTIVCFLAVIPTLWRQNDRLYAFLALIEVVILGFAASGILGVGGH